LSIAAASCRFFAAALSHSDLIITALFSLSASASLDIVLFKFSGITTSFRSTDSTSIHHGSVLLSTYDFIFSAISALFCNNSSSVTSHTAFLIVV